MNTGSEISIIDTNVFISSVFGGLPRQVVGLWFDGRITLCLSEPIVTEYQRVLREIGAVSEAEERALIEVFASGKGDLYTSNPPPIKGASSDPLESSILHFVGHPAHNKHVSDRRAANAVAVKLDHGTRIGLRRFVPHQAEDSPKRLAATGRLHVDRRRVLVILLSVSPGQVGPLLENVMSGANPGVLPVVYFNDQSRCGSD